MTSSLLVDEQHHDSMHIPRMVLLDYEHKY
jgi:hypothetical protein